MVVWSTRRSCRQLDRVELQHKTGLVVTRLESRDIKAYARCHPTREHFSPRLELCSSTTVYSILGLVTGGYINLPTTSFSSPEVENCIKTR